MYSALMSACAERAVSDDCDGAATAAAGNAADTVTVSLMLATLNWMDTVVGASSVTARLIPWVRFVHRLFILLIGKKMNRR